MKTFTADGILPIVSAGVVEVVEYTTQFGSTEKAIKNGSVLFHPECSVDATNKLYKF